jgi:hypothetical protein
MISLGRLLVGCSYLDTLKDKIYLVESLYSRKLITDATYRLCKMKLTGKNNRR